jgi:plastocyanin
MSAISRDAEVSSMKTRHPRMTMVVACLVGACLVVGAALLAGCAVTPQPGTVIIHDLQFDPPAVTVAKGTAVTWTNQDQIPVQIQTDSFGATPTVPGQFSSEPLNPGESYSHTFADTGTFDYSDPFHPYITGSVVVK